MSTDPSISMDKYQCGLQELIKLCLASNDEQVVGALWDFFLTPEEKENLAMRYLIVKELIKAEKPQRQIAKDLNVSIAKITRGSNELKRLDKQLLALLAAKI
jgi:TrpR family trp operon transcriptional repressor